VFTVLKVANFNQSKLIASIQADAKAGINGTNNLVCQVSHIQKDKYETKLLVCFPARNNKQQS
jgi:hypothetical protein